MTAKSQVFSKKPVNVEAIQFKDWSTAVDIFEWATDIFFVPRGYEHTLRRENEHDRGNGHIKDDAPMFLVVKTLEGMMRADILDWIIEGVQGEFYPCKPDIFSATYDGPMK